MDGRGGLIGMASEGADAHHGEPRECEWHAEDSCNGAPRYEDVASLGGMEISDALRGLTLFDDAYLVMQGFNVSIVDAFLNGLEERVLRRLFVEERTPVDDAAFLNAQSQMWVFATYEVMRTWRQLAGEVVKWHANGGLRLKLAAYEDKDGYRDPAKARKRAMLREVISKPQLVDGLRDDLLRTEMLFGRIEHLRVSLAKHEVRGRRGRPVIAPGYGRINQWCGALDYELSNGRYVLGYCNRRDIADALRALPSLPIPSQDELAAFAEYMSGPAD